MMFWLGLRLVVFVGVLTGAALFAISHGIANWQFGLVMMFGALSYAAAPEAGDYRRAIREFLNADGQESPR